jgi:hypothetical protein
MYLHLRVLIDFLQNFLTRKMECNRIIFFEDLALLIIKSHLPIHFLESPWLKQFALKSNPHIVFPSRITFSK